MRPAARSWPASALLVILLALVLAAQGGCGRHAGRSRASAGVPAASSGHAAASRPAPAGSIAGEGGLPRVDPGYLQWLERQSMLGLAPELAAQVSGTERLWRNSAGGDRVAVLLRAAPNWLALDPGSLDARPLLRALHAAGLPGVLPALGLEGLYLAPTGERADIWTAPGGTASGTAPDTASGAGPGGGVASFRPDPAVGDAEAFERLTAQAEAAGVQLGGELPPAATGLGPDFILQARHAPRFGGIYAMIEVPRELWGILPAAGGEWACRPLEAQAVAQLAGRGLLPARLARDNLAARHGGLAPGGWAATGEVRGADGNVRRWVYRYGPNPLRPVLLWQDPSGQARRILSAAIIQQTGLDGQTLTGLRFEALLGLDAEGADGADGVEGAAGAEGAGGAEAAAGDAAWLRGALMPGLEALDAASQEIHRYGGWAMQADALAPALTPLVLSGSVDFTRDTATPGAAAHALLTGDAAPLAAALRASFAAVDQCRLARGLDDWQRDWRPGLRDGWREARAGAAGPASAQGLSPAGSPAAVACRALGLNAPPRDSAQRRAVADAALTLLAWRIGLPGPAFFSPQDLSGALGEAEVWPVWDGGAQPGSALVFGSLAAQTREPDSVLATVSRLLAARKAAGLALGQGLAVAGGADGWVAAVSGLPGGGMWVTAVNVAPARRVVRVPLPRAATAARPAAGVPGAGAGAGGATAQTPRLLRNGRVLELALDGRQCGHVLLEER